MVKPTQNREATDDAHTVQERDGCFTRSARESRDAFTQEERARFDLTGLLPPRVETIEERCMSHAGACIPRGACPSHSMWERVLFFGAGNANIGIAQLLVAALVKAGLWQEQARRRCWFMDSKGLVVQDRADLAEHERAFAHDHARLSNLLAAVEAIRPTVLIGASGVPRCIRGAGACRHGPHQ
jgi:hypothetical protein